MRARLFVVLSALVVVTSLLTGCSEDRTPGPAAESPHAPASAVPGSHEDWCAEHEVAESMCTRCNPELIPAFQATSDWCEDHGLPESQCRVCNPNLVSERPAPEES